MLTDSETSGREGGHPVPKSLGPWEWFMRRGSPAEGELVLDPFMGTGTTMIAAEHLRRRSYGLELSPRWVDVACRRYQRTTGNKPTRADTGEPVDFDTSSSS